MKKLVSLILAIVMVATTFSAVAFAEGQPLASGSFYNSQNQEFYWELSEDGSTLTINGEGYIELTQVPEWSLYEFKNVVIGEGVCNIPQEAFLNATALESVVLSSTVTVIEDRAFYGCYSLKSFDFNNVSTIGSMAFYGCLLYTNITVPAGVKSIGSYAFGYFCDEALDIELAKIQGVTISARKATAAKEYALQHEIEYIDITDYIECFEYTVVDNPLVASEPFVMLTSYKGCSYSTDIVIPEEIDGYKVEWLMGDIFSGSDVTSVYIPATVKEISLPAFENADKLENIICADGGKYTSVDGVLYKQNGTALIKVPEAKTEITSYSENITTICENAFRNSSVKEVILPEAVDDIREYSFAFSALEKIVIPEGITSIPNFAFYGSENLNQVILPKTLEEIGANAFGHCTALAEINLPYGVKSIDGAAFHCAGLKAVTIPDSVTSVGNYAFGYYSADDIEFVKDEEFQIYGRGETAAEAYAIEHDFAFIDASPAQPSIWYAYTDRVSVTLFWEQTADAEYYEIYRSFDDKPFVKIAESAIDEDTVYSDLDVDNGQTYTYAVVGVKGCLRSAYNKTTTITFSKISTPALVSAAMTKNGIMVKWNTVADAEGYILYRKTENTEWTEIADFKGSVKSYEDTTVQSGVTYAYTVKAYSGAAESSCDYDGVSALYLSVPKIKTATNASKGIKITWTKVKGANGYIIGRKTSSSSWVKIATIGDVDNYTDKTAKAGTTYTYTVVPVRDGTHGFYSEKGVTCKRLSTVTTKSATNASDGVKIEWKPVSKCSGYKVYRKTEGGSYKRIATVKGATKSTYTDKTAKSGTSYVYKVVAYSGDYTSYYTEVSRYYLDNPTLKSVKSGKTGVTAKWETVKGASGYYVYRKEGSGSYKKIATVKGKTKKSYLDKSAKKGKTYTYKVKAYYSKTTSAYSKTKKITDKY